MKLTTQAGKVFSLSSLLVIPLVAFAMSASAFAALGGGPDSVSQDRAHFNAKDEVTQAGTYAVHEMQLASGSRVREYVSNSGAVFGVSWVSPVRPDLKQLLGSYFDQYAQAVQRSSRRHGPLVLHTDGLVVESSGHMRGFVGNAYVPSLMPEGVTANEIR